ncbi:hypothetical protein ATKI12_2233 [Kitasatospora sp. Ki12]
MLAVVGRGWVCRPVFIFEWCRRGRLREKSARSTFCALFLGRSRGGLICRPGVIILEVAGVAVSVRGWMGRVNL